MINRLEWSQTDVDEIHENVALFFGNTIFSQAYDWYDYTYYSMYETFKKLAQVFQEQARYEASKQYHDKVLADIQERLQTETPDIALLYPAEVPPGSFYPYLIGGGLPSKHWNDLVVGDALAHPNITDAQAGGGAIDDETLLDIDLEALAIRLEGEIEPEYFDSEICSHLQNHDVTSQLQAVQNDRVIYGNFIYQNSITYLFQLEQADQDFHPVAFGDEQLFDRHRVADIVNENFEA